MADNPEDIYSPLYVRRLFNEMAATYGVVNLISSFGFAARWRKQCLRHIKFHNTHTVIDLMTGMGELLPDIARRIGSAANITAIDISPEMCRRAREMIADRGISATIAERDALTNFVRPESADVVVSSFGLKTFSSHQLRQLAANVHDMLKSDGQFSFVEISVPSSRLLRFWYTLYIKFVIPTIGRIFLGNPDNYRMLGKYTAAFGNCAEFSKQLNSTGLIANPTSYFFGCATGVVGFKPKAHSSVEPKEENSSSAHSK